MLRRMLWALATILFMLPAVPLSAQQAGDYLDVTLVNVKPEKSAEFTAVSKKIADANRRNNGDRWVAFEALYGKGDTVLFTSVRQQYADIEKANESFMSAVNKAYGKDAADKLFAQWEATVQGYRSELRRRRWDLSSKAPTDGAAYAKLVGEARFLRTIAVHVRPGHAADFEALLQNTKAARDKSSNAYPLLISQAVEGYKDTTFYVSTLRSSLATFDNNPTIREVLGEEGYKKFLQVNAESVESTESWLFRISPEISNPPDEVVAAAPDFWRPKHAAAPSSTKSKTDAMKPAEEKPKP